MFDNYLEVKDLYMKYFGGYLAVDMVSFNLCKGEIFPIFGGYLSGKTSLLRCLASLEEYEGQIKYNDDVIHDISFTFGLDSLKKNNTVYNTLLYPLKLRKIEKANEIIENKAKQYLIYELLNKKIKELTIKEKQLVILVRAMLRECKMYLIDNPFNNFEEEERQKYFQILKEDLKGKTCVYTTNNIDEAFLLNDKIGILVYGKLMQVDTKDKMLKKPNNIEILRSLKINDFLELKLLKDEYYYVEIDGEKIKVNEPISNIYNNKVVLFPIIDGKINNEVYFDYTSEYLASKVEV